MTVAKRLQASLSAPYEFDGDTAPVGTQIGMATYPEHGSTAEELLSHAELSVHKLKSMVAMLTAQMLLKFRR